MKKILLYLFLSFPYMAIAQNALPDTEILLVDVTLSKNGIYSFGDPKNITNRIGYDNQPSFLNNDTILFTSIRDKQADVYLYSLVTGKTVPITNTPEDEYSPTLMPDWKHISVVRVEKDSTQRLWKFSLKKPNDFFLVLPDVKGVGYHAWINDTLVGLFLLRHPNAIFTASIKSRYLYQVNMHKDFAKKEPTEAGRAVQKIDDQSLAYCAKGAGVLNGIKIYKMKDSVFVDNFKGLASNYVTHIINLPENSEDFIYFNDAYWVGSGSKLMRFDPKIDKVWIEMHDFKGTPAENFYRLAFSPDGKKLALVSYTGKKP